MHCVCFVCCVFVLVGFADKVFVCVFVCGGLRDAALVVVLLLL